MVLSSRIRLPADTGALLWDMDGVLLDTLALELVAVQELVAARIPGAPHVSRETVRRLFALSIADFWRAILAAVGAEADEALVTDLTAELERVRTTGRAEVLPGVRELLDGAADAGLKVAVVSNNPASHVVELLERAGLAAALPIVVGNDQGLPGKPAPDMYLAGAAAVGLPPERCVALEDSLLGAEAGRSAGCWVVGVATGSATFAELKAAPTVDRAFRSFTPSTAVLAPGDVTDKRLDSPNEFVSHMLEHIAWRTGCSFALDWACDDWLWLGETVGDQLEPLLDGDARAARALGLIDDGSCEVTITRTSRMTDGVLMLQGVAGYDAERFVGLRVEQLADGQALVDVLEGLARAAGLGIRVDIASVEDPHHTWEAIFRAVGVALRGLSRTLTAHADGTGPTIVERDDTRAARGYGLQRQESSSPGAVRMLRTTAESRCTVEVAVAAGPLALTLETSDAVDSDGLIALVAELGLAAGLSGTIDFSALELSSSHVVAEDVGMTLGAALKELATDRMNAFGIEGAGSSIDVDAPIRVGVSWEGRKFLQLVPIGWSREELRDQVIGSTLPSGLFSEDLDDFLDGFVGGMGCSVVVHWEPVADVESAWLLVFTGLGTALAGLLAPNHAKRALIAGVKATLA
ncbi:HAD-superfamily hydrolase [Paraconexibacter sp. AEG42_29]|uniref:HAD-superfamily hydrolase n=1 Tax=Paraconexibacter sp. AEG42_29 TaxID=2997339 RepID=A0AAU7AT77_9ACTN